MHKRKMLALVLCSSLCLMFVMAIASPSPTVPISGLASLDQGTRVRVVGILVDLAIYDSGTEGLVLLDAASSCTARVFCSPGVRFQPSYYASIGDKLGILGETGKPGNPPILFSRSDDVSLLEEAQLVLTLDILSENWQLFLGDSISVSGKLVNSSAGFRLASSVSQISVMIESESAVLPSLVGSEITVSGKMMFDSQDMSLVIVVVSISLAA